MPTSLIEFDTGLHIQEHTPETATETLAINLLFRLEQYTYEQKHEQFRAIVETEDWSLHPPTEILRVVDLALHLGMNQQAMQLAQEAAQLYPHHERVQRAARVLAPASGRTTQTVHPVGLQASREWLRSNAQAYRGQWVAVYAGELAGVAGTLKKLQAMVSQKYTLESLLITKVY